MSKLRQAWTWVKAQINRFETWVAEIAPSWKTYSLTALGFVGDAAYALQGFVTGLPPTTFMSAETLGIVNLVLYILIFWLKDIRKRTGVE